MALMETEELSPKRLASPFGGRRKKPTLASMPSSFLTSFASSEDLVYCSNFEKHSGKRIRKMKRLSQSFTEISRLTKRTKGRFSKFKNCFKFKKDTADTIFNTSQTSLADRLECLDPALFAHLCLFLSLKEVLDLSSTNRTLRRMTSKAFLRLHESKKTFGRHSLKCIWKQRVIGLNFSYDHSPMDITPFLNKAQLVSLKLSSLGELNLKFLEHCPNLVSLSLSGIGTISSTESLRFLPGLKSFSLRENCNISRIPLFARSLQFLSFSQTEQITCLANVSYLPRLQEIQVEVDTDLVISFLLHHSLEASTAASVLSLLNKKLLGEAVVSYREEALQVLVKYLQHPPSLVLLNTLANNNVYIMNFFSSYSQVMEVLLDKLQMYLADDKVHLVNTIASTLLKFGLVKHTREKFYSVRLIKTLIRLMYYDNRQINIEAAGTIWNLAASLPIGRQLAEQLHFDCLTPLVYTLRVRSIRPKAQAIGALRNLAIVKENATVLMEKSLVPHLVHIINQVIDPAWSIFAVADLKGFEAQVEEHSREAEERFDRDIGTYFQNVVSKSRGLDEDQRTLLAKAAATLRLLTASPQFNRSETHNAGTVLKLFSRLFCLSLLSCEVDTTPFLTFQDLGEDILTDSASSLLSLSFDAVLRNLLGSPVLVKTLVRTIKESSNVELLLPCCGILWNLALSDTFEAMIVGAGGLQALLPCLGHENKLVANKAAGALKNLLFHSEHKQMALDINAHKLLFQEVHKVQTSIKLNGSSQVESKLLLLLLSALKMLAGTNLHSRIDFIKLGVVELISDLLEISREKTMSAEYLEVVRYCVDILDYVSGLLVVSQDSLSESNLFTITEFCLQAKQHSIKAKLVMLTYSSFGSVAQPAKWSSSAKSILERIPEL